jgi:PIN domain nuclease of toxin-antitoxin system
MTKAITGYALTLLPITFDDCAEYVTLPFPLSKRRNPFDRLIITHAKRNSLSIVGSDVAFDSYGITRLW